MFNLIKFANSAIRVNITRNFAFTSSRSNKKDGGNPPDVVEPEDKSLPIPQYQHREGETLQIKKSRVLYQARKRGMLENGLLLSTFASKYLKEFNEKQTHDFDHLINMPSNDWDIYYWATGVKPIPDEYNTDIMQLFIKHVKNENKEQRFSQPDLY